MAFWELRTIASGRSPARKVAPDRLSVRREWLPRGRYVVISVAPRLASAPAYADPRFGRFPSSWRDADLTTLIRAEGIGLQTPWNGTLYGQSQSSQSGLS